MDKNAIKKYAVWARRELIERVSQKALQYGITADCKADPNADSVSGRLLTDAEKKQRRALIRKVNEHGYEQIIEEVAYTWFNRFAALRFMEVNGYLPSHVRVFTNDAGEFKPQILSEAIHLDLDGLNMDKVYELKNANQDEELFKYLLVTQCNALSPILPKMFQRIADDTELLLPDYLLREGSVIHQMITMIPEEDWRDQVQIIGWLYQYYNTDLKAKADIDVKSGLKIDRNNLPEKTQVFTPDWIVRYMVENSLGRLWLEGHPNDALKSQWEYYLDEAEQETDVRAQLDAIRREYAALKPEDIKCIDPCMGSGHILCYLFDVLVQVYEDYGHTAREAVGSIVEKNLWGLDIDDRAAQLAYFAVMMKARQYDRRFFAHPVQPNVYAIQESNWIGGAFPFDMGNFLLSKEHQETLNYLIDSFHDAKEYGSILQLEQRDYAGFIEAWELTASQTAEKIGLLLWYDAIKDTIPELAKIAIALTQKYHVVCTNPPYLGLRSIGSKTLDYIQANYSNSKNDFFAVFIERALSMTLPTGHVGLVTAESWLSLSSFEKIRINVLTRTTVTTMLHLGEGAFDAGFGTVAFSIKKVHVNNYIGTYFKLNDIEDGEWKKSIVLQRKNVDFQLFDHNGKRVLVFDVKRRPVGLPVQCEGVAWIYEGDTLKPMPEDMRRRIYEEIGIDFSGTVCAGAAVDDLDETAIENFRANWIEKSGKKQLATLSKEQLLHDCGAITDDGVTYAALILFGKKAALAKFLPQAEIVFEYRSSEVSGPANQREEFKIGFFACYDRIWELVNLRNDKQHYQEGFFVFDISTFNERVVREAILNAVSHRNYQLSGNVFVRQYRDRLVVESPGGFPLGISLDNILDRQAPRNRRIAEMLSLCGMVERSGQGMNLMYELSVQEAKPLPDFTGTDDYFVSVTLNGLIIDKAMLSVINRIGDERMESLSTDDFLAIDALYHQKPLTDKVRSRLKRLTDMGIVEHAGRNKYVLARSLYAATGQTGVHTRRVGLDRDTNKELLLKHIRSNGKSGTPLKELYQVLPGHSRSQIQTLLRELRDEGKVFCKGKTNNARWHTID